MIKRVLLAIAIPLLWASTVFGFTGPGSIWAQPKGSFTLQYYDGDTTGFGRARDACIRRGGGVITLGPGLESLTLTYPNNAGLLIIKQFTTGFATVPPISGGISGGGGGLAGVWVVKSGDTLAVSYPVTQVGIQGAFDACTTPGGLVYIGPGTYSNLTNFTIYAKTTVQGGGALNTILIRSSSATGTFFREKTLAEGNGSGATGIIIKDISFWGNNRPGDALDLGNQVGCCSFTSNAYLQHILVRDFPSGIGIKLNANAIWTGDVWVGFCQTGLYLTGGASYFDGWWFEGNSVTGLRIPAAAQNTFIHPQFEDQGVIASRGFIDIGDGVGGHGSTNTFLSPYMAVTVAQNRLINEQSGASNCIYTAIKVNVTGGGSFNHTIYDEAWSSGTGAKTYYSRDDLANGVSKDFYDKSTNTKATITGSNVIVPSLTPARLGPYSTSTTGGAIRIVDGITFPLTVAGVQSALNECSAAGGGTTMLPASANIQVSNVGIKIPNRVKLLGMGTVLDALPTFDCTSTCNVGAIIENSQIDGTQAYAALENISVQGDTSGTATDSVGIRFRSIFWHSYLEKVQVRSIKGTGIILDDPGNHGLGPIQLDQVVINTLAKSTLGDGIRVGSKTVGVWNGITISNSGVERWGTGAAAIRFLGNCAVSASIGGSAKDIYLEQYSDGLADGIVLDGVTNIVVDGITFNGAGAINYPIKVIGTTGAVCGTYGNTIKNIYANNDTILFDQANNIGITNVNGSMLNEYITPSKTYSYLNVIVASDSLRVAGRVDLNNSLILRQGADITSAATIAIGDANFYNLTGANTVTDITGPSVGTKKLQKVTFYITGALQITNGSHWILNGNFNGNGVGGKDVLVIDWDGTNATEDHRTINP